MRDSMRRRPTGFVDGLHPDAPLFSMDEDEVEMPGGGQRTIGDLEEAGELTPDLMRKARPEVAITLIADDDAERRVNDRINRQYSDYTAGAVDDVLEQFARNQLNRSLNAAAREASPAYRARRAAERDLRDRAMLREYALGLGDQGWADAIDGRKGQGVVYAPEAQMSEADRAAEMLAREQAMAAGRRR